MAAFANAAVIRLGTSRTLRSPRRRALRVARKYPTARTPLDVARDAQTVYARDKPWWCQPWTILSTGTIVVGSSWQLPAVVKYWIALPVTLGVFVWWWLFLVLYPQASLGQDADSTFK